ncbi:MAG: maleylpyruvate isomerase N-terminal domain-containing protein [Chloroflexi bacterium]|nr:maleylpyruvate isomerase N-terminal domain-containing protein [Chloroflexota bacterium]MCI0839348.1 maleylpyruvate isomerase N-terminal domain-containing protein [Chloroflexota bacterium]
MTLPTAQHAVVDLQHAHRELLRVVDALSPEEWDRGLPYGDWTIKDLIAHLVGDLSPSGAGLIYAGVLNEQFIADTSRFFDVRGRNQAVVDERRRWTHEDLRQVLFEAHDARIAMTLRLDERHEEILTFAVPMGPEYDLKVEDWLWFGYHDRQHTDDISRALAVDWTPRSLDFLPEIEEKLRWFVRSQEGFLRAVYSVATDAWGDPAHGEAEGWSHKSVLAHVASNEERLQIRFRSVAGEAAQAEIDAVNDVDAWNREKVSALTDATPAQLVDLFLKGRNETIEVLAAYQRSALDGNVTVAGGESVPLLDFIDRVSNHTSWHAAQLVPASSRARLGGDR